MQDIITMAKRLELVVFDVDGVMTDGGLIFGENGNEYKVFNVKDGHGLVMLRNTGFRVAVITARTSSIVSERMSALGIEYVYQGQYDKGQTMKSLVEDFQLSKEKIAYVGDDLVDIAGMQYAGLAIAVADAHPMVIKQADWTTTARGGQGAVREVCDLIMQAKGTLEKQVNRYLHGRSDP